ncbi:MAG: RNA polymerase sigma factor [Bacteroidota bacterium]
MISENELIDGCLNNDRKAQKLLYEKYSSKMFGVCMRYAKSKEEAEDILSDSFVQIFVKLSSFKREGSFEGWIRRIVVNTSITAYRNNLKFNLNDEISEVHQLSDDSETAIDLLNVQQIKSVIQQMPDGYRMIFNLYVIEGYNHREIAELIGINEGTSKSQFSKAKKWLQNRLIKYSIAQY